MYLTAQRLYQHDKKTAWINAFYRIHGDAELQGMSWLKPDVALVANEHPGKIIGALIDVYPGGNPVDSYIDLVARDKTPGKRIRTVLSTIRTELPTGKEHKQWLIDQVAARVYFGKHIRSRNFDTFDDFRDRLVKLLSDPHKCSWKSRKKPLVVEVSFDGDGLQYKLSKESVKKIALTRGKRWAVPVITVKHTVKQNFEKIHGDLRQTILETVTGLDRSKLLDQGGVVFKGLDPGIDNWEWPSIPAGD